MGVCAVHRRPVEELAKRLPRRRNRLQSQLPEEDPVRNLCHHQWTQSRKQETCLTDGALALAPVAAQVAQGHWWAGGRREFQAGLSRAGDGPSELLLYFFSNFISPSNLCFKFELDSNFSFQENTQAKLQYECDNILFSN